MSRKSLIYTTLLFCLLSGVGVAYGQAAGGSRAVAIIHISEAVTRTQEGRKLAEQIEAKYNPTKDRLEKKNREIASLREQLNKGANTMSDDAKRRLIRQIQTQERKLKRDTEDAEADFQRELQEFQQAVGTKIMTVIDKYAKEKGFSVVLDISSPQTPVLYAINEINITSDIIQRYDQEYPVAAASTSSSSATSPAAASPSPAAKPTP